MSPVRDQLTGSVGRVRSRVSGAVRRRVRTVRERSARQEAPSTAGGMVGRTALAAVAADDRVAELAFGGGFLVHSADTPGPPLGEHWETRRVADRVYHVRTPLAFSTTRSGETVVLLGHPVDVDAGTAQAQAVTDRLAALADSADSTDSPDSTEDAVGAVLEAAAYLGGRWTLFLHGPDGGLTVLPDALASCPVWFTDDGAVIGSHEALVPGGNLLAVNSLLDVSATGVDARSHDVTGGTVAEATYEEFRERLVEHTRLVAGTGRAGIGLTAGTASRAVLSAYLPHRRPDDFTFTHFATESARAGREQATDLFGASALSHLLGVPHRVVRTTAPPAGSVFEAAYRLTSPHGDSAATAFARHHLPPETVELHSAGAPVCDLQSWGAVPDAVRDGDLGHRVALPFNDRLLLEMLVHQPPGEDFVSRLAEELPAAE